MRSKPEPKPEPVHEHRWVPVSSQPVKVTNTVTGPNGFEGTLVLQRCLCGAVNSTPVLGRWSDAQLGIDAATVNDLLTLLGDLDTDDP